VANNPKIYHDLVAAAGFSDKAAHYFPTQELRDALIKVLEAIHEQAHADWRDEVLYCFLLTKGDSMGALCETAWARLPK